MKAFIYKILNKVNQKFYIGSTSNFKERKAGHLRQLKQGVHHSKHLQYSYNIHGKSNFEVSIVEEFEYSCKSEIFQKEQYYIDTLKPHYNNSPTAGSCLGMKKGGYRVINTATNEKFTSIEDVSKLFNYSFATLRRKLQDIAENDTPFKIYTEVDDKIILKEYSKKKGTNKIQSRNIAVDMFLEDKFIQSFISASEAARHIDAFPGNILNCCSGVKGYKKIKGYTFKFKENDKIIKE